MIVQPPLSDTIDPSGDFWEPSQAENQVEVTAATLGWPRGGRALKLPHVSTGNGLFAKRHPAKGHTTYDQPTVTLGDRLLPGGDFGHAGHQARF